MKRVFGLSVLLISTLAVAQQKVAEQYGQIPNAAQGNVLILFGNENEQSFLKGLAAAAKKATFICDNVEAQSVKSYTVSLDRNGNYTFSVTAGNWPVNETIAICGQITILQSYQKMGETVTAPVSFRFGAWGSAMAYPDVRTQVPALQRAYVDYCPQYSNTCDNPSPHPEPALTLPEHSASVQGKVGIHDCRGHGTVLDADVEVVLNSTDEGRAFNQSTHQDSVCDEIPHEFDDPATAFTATKALDEHNRYSLEVKFKGSSASGALYVCASVIRHSGSDEDNCEKNAEDGHVFTKRAVTFYPNGNLNEDVFHDYTQ